jgi:hypothetical protein
MQSAYNIEAGGKPAKKKKLLHKWQDLCGDTGPPTTLQIFRELKLGSLRDKIAAV